MVIISSTHTYGTQPCSWEPSLMVIMCPIGNPNLTEGYGGRVCTRTLRGPRCSRVIRMAVGGVCGDSLVPTHLQDTAMQLGAISDGDHVPHR